jgi:transposase
MRRITRSYRIRSYPNGAQRRLRDRWFGAYRWLWNTALEIRTAAYRERGLTLSGNDMSRWLTQWKATQGHEWLKVVPATSLGPVGAQQKALAPPSGFRKKPQDIVLFVFFNRVGRPHCRCFHRGPQCRFAQLSSVPSAS